MEQKLRLDNSQGGVVDSKILMILITFCRGDTGFLKCTVTETGTVVDKQSTVVEISEHITSSSVKKCQKEYQHAHDVTT